MFWKKKKPEEERRKQSEKAAKGIDDGPLWGYMVNRCGEVVDVLQQLRRVEREGAVDGEPVTMVRIFDPAAAAEAGVVVDSYESLDGCRNLILYEGYYRGPEMADINISRVTCEEAKV